MRVRQEIGMKYINVKKIIVRGMKQGNKKDKNWKARNEIEMKRKWEM
jgi:hypothetical protein